MRRKNISRVIFAYAFLGGFGLLLASGASDSRAYARDALKETAGESRPQRIRRPSLEFHEKENGIDLVLPAFAKEELLTFEERLLAPRKTANTRNSVKR